MAVNGFVPDMPEDEYHAHEGSLSVTGAKTLLKAPALFKWQQDHPVHSDVFDVGSAAHKLVLGVGAELSVYDGDSWRSKAAQEFRDTTRAAGKVPLLKADHDRVQAMADKLSEHTLAMSLLSDGQPEVSSFCVDDETGVLRRARFDYLRDDLIVDYKTAASSDPQEFRNSAARYGYFQQHAWYLDLAHDLGHSARGFLFIVQMKEPPYLVSVVELTARAVDRGRELNHRALERFRDCTAADLWPGYGDDITPIDLPAWAYYDQEPAA